MLSNSYAVVNFGSYTLTAAKSGESNLERLG
jgi:hypothetical protein